MVKSVKYSIVIPVYNVEAYLGDCLDSVLNQGFQDWEAICVNDGSTDNSLSILTGYVQQDSRFVLIDQKNGGLSAARNAALDVAQGEFVLFLDSDDVLRKDTLELLKCCIDANSSVEMIAFNSILWYPEYGDRKAPNEAFNHAEHCLFETGNDYLRDFVAKRGWGPSAACFYMYRRSLLEREMLRFPLGKTHEDNLFVPMAVCCAKQVIILPEDLYLYRMRNTSIVHQQSEKNYRDKLSIAHILCEELTKHGVNEATRCQLVRDLAMAGLIGLRKARIPYRYSDIGLVLRNTPMGRELLKVIKKLYL